MNATPPSFTQNHRSASLEKIAWGVLIVITLYVCYFSHLGVLGFVGPDEPRYAWIAREMAETGDWVTPRLYGQPWFEKPVLYYWTAAVTFKLFGVSEVAARLPSAFAALFATLAMAWLALRLAGGDAARWLLVLLPSTVGMIGFSRAATPDMLFSAALALAMISAAAVLKLIPVQITNRGNTDSLREKYPVAPVENSSSKSLQSLPSNPSTQLSFLTLFLFGFFLGAAVLAKGPAAVILAGGAILPWALLTGRWRDSLRLFHPLAIVAFLLTSLPWYILCARRNPDFFHIFIIKHNFNRYLTPQFQHIQPFWYYLPITFLALLPWTVWLAWFAIREARTSQNQLQRAQILFVAAWTLFPLIFFSLSQSKLPGYILPAVPALALLISLAVAHSLKSYSSLPRYALAAIGILFSVSACWVAIAASTHRASKSLHWTAELGSTLIFLFIFFAGLGGLAVLAAGVLRRARTGLVTAIMLMLILLTLGYVSLGRLDPQLSARNAAAQISPARAPITYSFKLQRAWQYHLNFYLHREIPEWNPAIPGRAVVLTNERNLPELRKFAEIITILSDHSSQAEIVEIAPLPCHVSAGGQPL